MELEGIGIAIWVLIIFIIAGLNASLCRGLGKSTEINPEFLANMGFWWVVLPSGMIAATVFKSGWNISEYAYFGFVFGLVPVICAILLRKADVQGQALFGRDDQNRLSFLGCSPDELVITLLYSLLSMELATVFLWDQLYRT